MNDGWSERIPCCGTATRETLFMVGVATLVTVLLGLPLGVLLMLTDRGALSRAPAREPGARRWSSTSAARCRSSSCWSP